MKHNQSNEPSTRPIYGRVALVGAGPGDPELLTIKAIGAIKRATVILVDDLVNPEILTHASPKARIIKVGKRGGCSSTPQSFIEKLMILGAQNGEDVVRLKGGDPFIFGRGGEEVAHLRAAGIQVEIINGITSGLAACTALNVALTHRDHAHGVVFLTGHNRPGDSSTDWIAMGAAVKACKLTLIVYMGISGACEIQSGLLESLNENTPAGIIQQATLPSQKLVICTLATLTHCIQENSIQSPAIIVIGDVLKGAQSLMHSQNFNVAIAA